MEILELISIKDLIILFAGGLVGYLANMIVAKQTDKSRGLVLETTGRRVIIESATSCPFTINDQNGNQLDNVYLINVRVWNKGKKHVERTSISKEHPLEIHLDEEAEILGDPIVFRGSDKIGLNIQRKQSNTYSIDFECVNPDEWSELGFFVKDTPNVNVTASGRVYGQNHDFNLTIDDSRASWFERVFLGLILIFVFLSPIALFWGGWWLLTDYSLSILINESDKIPENLSLLLAYGFFTPLIALISFSEGLLKKRGNPKSYPIDEDFRPDEAKNIGALWGTALSGKNYRVSASSHNQGEIYIPNEKIRG